jgi:hypothetical protein
MEFQASRVTVVEIPVPLALKCAFTEYEQSRKLLDKIVPATALNFWIKYKLISHFVRSGSLRKLVIKYRLP